MVISIHQPQYLPWAGYFNKIYKSDVFVFLDDVQYKKNEWQNRNRIKTATGDLWLTIPAHYKFGQRINEIEIDKKVNWRREHIRSIEVNYRKSKFYRDFFPVVENLLSNDYKFLVDANIDSILAILKFLGMDKKTLKSSELSIEGKKSLRLVNICKNLNADTYLSGKGAEEYIDEEIFKKDNIKLMFQKYELPKYEQLYGDFVPNLSIVDIIFNCGREETLKMLE